MKAVKGQKAVLSLQRPSSWVPGLVKLAGPKASRRFVEFFTAQIRNKNTREAYARALVDFLAWSEDRNLELAQIAPFHVAAYVEYMGTLYKAPTVKQHLAAIRMCFDYLVTGHILETNPASSVRGPKHVVKKGKTPVLTSEEANILLKSIDSSTPMGLRDRALIGTMIYTFSRATAAVSLRLEDYYRAGNRSWLRLHEKGGKFQQLPVHPALSELLDDYLRALGVSCERDAPLFRAAKARSGELTERPISRQDALRMVKRRCKAAGLSKRFNCHSFRATGITTYRRNGGSLENAQMMAGHESPRTTMLYDRTDEDITLDEVKRILI